jgi:hypothetical protein
VTLAVNKIPSARIVIADDDFAISDSAALIPGKTVRIAAGYGASQSVIFEGLVIRHGVRAGASGGAQLVLECRDRALGMTVGRKCATFIGMATATLLARWSHLIQAWAPTWRPPRCCTRNWCSTMSATGISCWPAPKSTNW